MISNDVRRVNYYYEYIFVYLSMYVCMYVCIKVDSEWIVPFMSAYVDVRTECQVEDAKFTMLFVSRRSKYRQGRPDIQSVYVCMYAFMYVCMDVCMYGFYNVGCRFTKRGWNENGNAENFVV